MNNSVIAKTAIIDPSAKIGNNVQIGDYAIIEADTIIGDGCTLKQHSIVRRYTELKENVFVDSFAAVGADNQDLKFDPSIRSGTIIGSGTTIREGVTIHRGSFKDVNTIIGKNCLIMGNVHIAHDCIVGNNVIIANGALLAGHIITQDRCILSGNTAFHQFIRIGYLSMTSGLSSMTYDIPPFVITQGRNEIRGLNVVGLRRAGFTNADLQDLKNLYRMILGKRGNSIEQATSIKAEGKHGNTKAGKIFLDFFKEESTRGFLNAYKDSSKDQ